MGWDSSPAKSFTMARRWAVIFEPRPLEVAEASPSRARRAVRAFLARSSRHGGQLNENDSKLKNGELPRRSVFLPAPAEHGQLEVLSWLIAACFARSIFARVPASRAPLRPRARPSRRARASWRAGACRSTSSGARRERRRPRRRASAPSPPAPPCAPLAEQPAPSRRRSASCTSKATTTRSRSRSMPLGSRAPKAMTLPLRTPRPCRLPLHVLRVVVAAVDDDDLLRAAADEDLRLREEAEVARLQERRRRRRRACARRPPSSRSSRSGPRGGSRRPCARRAAARSPRRPARRRGSRAPGTRAPHDDEADGVARRPPGRASRVPFGPERRPVDADRLHPLAELAERDGERRLGHAVRRQERLLAEADACANALGEGLERLGADGLGAAAGDAPRRRGRGPPSSRLLDALDAERVGEVRARTRSCPCGA